MADAKITALDALTTMAAADVLAFVSDPGGTPITKKITLTNLLKSVVPYTGATANVALGAYTLSAAGITVSAAAAATTREKIAEFKVDDDAVSVVAIANLLNTDAAFMAGIIGLGGATNHALSLVGECPSAQDSGASALVAFNARLMANDYLTGTASDVATRALFHWENNSTVKMTMDAAGQLGIGVTPTAKLDVAGTCKLGAADTDVLMLTGRAVFRTAASDPKHATPASRPAGSVGEIAYYTGKLYLCTNAATPTWEAITSS
jgi:hypothetical protein